MHNLTRSGIFLIDKPAGITSQAALTQLKRRLGINKVGHSGTLDPFATGLLVCFTDGATKFASYGEAGVKNYLATVLLGTQTDTDDNTGTTIATSQSRPSQQQFSLALRDFIGEIDQIPPQFSAIKLAGEPAYKKARRGEQVELKSRRVTIFKLDLVDFSSDQAVIRVCCSPGTYIRSIARDLGLRFGCGGCLSTLRRESSAPFTIADTRPLDQLNWEDLRPWESLFPDVPRVSLERDACAALLNGNQSVLINLTNVTNLPTATLSCLFECDGKAIGLLLRDLQGYWRLGPAVRSFEKS